MNVIPLNGTVIDSVTPPDALGWLQHRAPRRYSDMTSLEGELRERSAKARTLTLPNRELKLLSHPEPRTADDRNALLVQIGDSAVTGLTHWSFGQLSGLAGAPAGYMRTLPGHLVKNNIEWGLQFNREVEDVKAYFDGVDLRAVTGPQYGRVDDYLVVEAVNKILDTGRWVPADDHMGLSATDRSLQMFLIDKANPIVVGRAPNGMDDVIYRGLRISNSELGYSSLKLEAFLFRAYCLNGQIMGIRDSEGVVIRHTSNAPYRWAREVQPAIEAYANEDASSIVNQVQRLKERNVADDDDRAREWLQARGLTAAQAKQTIESVQNEENRHARTAWDMVQGISAMARSIPSPEARSDVEQLAGRLWQKLAA